MLAGLLGSQLPRPHHVNGRSIDLHCGAGVADRSSPLLPHRRDHFHHTTHVRRVSCSLADAALLQRHNDDDQLALWPLLQSRPSVGMQGAATSSKTPSGPAVSGRPNFDMAASSFAR